MKKVLFILAVILLFLLISCISAPPKATAPAPRIASQGSMYYQADSKTWEKLLVDGEGSIFNHEPRVGDSLYLRNKAGSFKVEVTKILEVRVSGLPPNFKSVVLIEFKNADPNGQLPTGRGLVTVRR